MSCFFFQAEDGIRDATVTGVQTCALPISRRSRPPGAGPRASPSLVRSASGGRAGQQDDLAVAREVEQIGRASCRERVWVAVGGGAVRKERRRRPEVGDE